mmetsp:Transcript_23364/g.28705  ORF Transcript_23364/g.28705 Transcript_23364/m.28705 type:complete len:153 (-) Transcript_23364:230-688(-)
MRKSISIAVTTLMSLSQQTSALSAAPPKKWYGGAGVGRFTLDDGESWKCAYDMVLVERIQGKPKTKGGLYVPQEDLPRLHLCRVVSLGPGREEENGNIAPMPDIKPGDYVIAKNPWGIGPKDEETNSGKKLSFMRSQDIAAVLDGDFVGEES